MGERKVRRKLYLGIFGLKEEEVILVRPRSFFHGPTKKKSPNQEEKGKLP